MITYRPTKLEELEAIDDLVVSSINDLTEKHGFGRMASRSEPRFQVFSLEDDPRGLWTAQEVGEHVGFAWSWACEDLWFLAQLFVKPGLQARGTGRELLRQTLEHADAVGARQRALITFSFNTVSQGLYIQHGFAPRFPVYSMSVDRNRLDGGDIGPALPTRILDGSDAQMQALGDVDRQAIGVSREKHHRLLGGESGIRAVGFHDDGGSLIGYVYVSAAGHIGPLAVVSANLMQPAFASAVNLAMTQPTERVSCFLPGSNMSVLRQAIGVGLRIKFPMLMMSTEDLGSWACYLPRNPGFM